MMQYTTEKKEKKVVELDLMYLKMSEENTIVGFNVVFCCMT